jgi:hypothetical protein
MPFQPIASRIQMNVLAAQGSSAYPEGAGKFLGQGAVMVLGAKPTENTHAEGRFEVTSLAAASHICVRPWAILADNAFQLHCDFVNSLVPGDSFKTITHPLQRVFEAVGIMLMIRYIHPFAA